MKAMILAAGLGTRLRPLTGKRPKALVPVVNKPVITYNIEYLKKHGIKDIVVNAHHHYRMLSDYLDRGRPFGMDIEVRIEKEILGTGGGIKNCSDFFENQPFIVINSDIITDINLTEAISFHLSNGGLATMILHDYERFNQVSVNRQNMVVDIAPDKVSGRLAFACIHVIGPELLSYLPPSMNFNIIGLYRDLISSGKRISAYVSSPDYWRDIGDPESYILANRELLSMEDRACAIGADSSIDPSAELEEWAVVGEGAIIEENACISRSVLWNNVRIKKGVRVIDSIVTSFQEIRSDLISSVL
jgi:mannose-1-phosphate guanylyltransferase